MASRKKESDQFVRCFDVSEPRKHERGFTIYKVTQKLVPVDFQEVNIQEVIVWRRYNDFKKLYKAMVTIHKSLRRRGVFPPFAKAKVFGRYEASIIEERRNSAQDLLNFVGQRPHLVNSKAFKQFFEGGEKVFVDPSNDPILQPIPYGDWENDSDTTSLTSDVPEMTPPPGAGNKEPLTFEALSEDEEINKLVAELGGVWQYRVEDLDSQDDGDNSSQHSRDTLTPTLVHHHQHLTDSNELSASDLSHVVAYNPDLKNNGSPGRPNWLQTAKCQLSNDGSGLINVQSTASFKQLEEELQLPLPSVPKTDIPRTDDSVPHNPPAGAAPDVKFNIADEHSDDAASNSDIINEFDPISSDRKVTCGKGDLNFSLLVPAKEPVMKMAKPTPSTKQAPSRSKAVNEFKPGSQVSPVAKLKQMDLNDKGYYIVQAAQQISCAQQAEASRNYQMAFNYYKNGVGLLLSGVQGDDNPTRIEVVRRKTARYLLRAEEINEEHLRDTDENRWDTGGDVTSVATLPPSVALLQAPLPALKNYNVLGIVNNVILVFDNVSGRSFIVKSIPKTSDPSLLKRISIVPIKCPYMVQLHRFFESESTIYLVLQYASGGRLWSYVSNYLQQQGDVEVADIIDNVNEEKLGSRNIYSGVHQSTNKNVESQSEVSRAGESQSEVSRTVESQSEVSRTKMPSVENFVCDSNSGAPVEQANELEKESCVLRKDSDFLGKFDPNDLSLLDCEDTAVPSLSRLSSDGDGFQSLLTTTQTKQSIDQFSINSFDSDRGAPSVARLNSSTSDNFESIPESSEPLSCEIEEVSSLETIDSPTNNIYESSSKPSGRVAPPGALSAEALDIIEDANNFVDDVDRILAEADSDVLQIISSNSGEGETEIAVGPGTYYIKDVQTSTPKKSSSADAVSADYSEGPSIYDLHGVHESDDSIGDSSDSEHLNTTQGTIGAMNNSNQNCDTEQGGSQPQACTRRAIHDQIHAANRGRHMSGVFGELDLAAEELLADAQQDVVVHLPEGCVKQWAAEIVVALNYLHRMGIICRDLNPDNLLLGERGHILLTYFSQWSCVDNSLTSKNAKKNLYTAPEISRIYEVTSACDWWSLGVLLFELLTGKTFVSCHPSGVTSHSNIMIPEHVSKEAQSLLRELLHHNAQERLGSGLNGGEDVKMHPFFNGINWQNLQDTMQES